MAVVNVIGGGLGLFTAGSGRPTLASKPGLPVSGDCFPKHFLIPGKAILKTRLLKRVSIGGAYPLLYPLLALKQILKTPWG
jgi:hypothetical protein